jgi:hypothetical protein
MISSLFTKWGLFRSYWVLLKLVMMVPATFFLLQHRRPIDLLAGAAETSGVLGVDLFGARREMVIDAVAALVVLLLLTVLSVYKPRGLTPYGQWKQDEQRPDVATVDAATSTAQGIVDERDDNGVRPATL